MSQTPEEIAATMRHYMDSVSDAYPQALGRIEALLDAAHLPAEERLAGIAAVLDAVRLIRQGGAR